MIGYDAHTLARAGDQIFLRGRGGVIEASCFPWGNPASWESCATDECIRLLSLGHKLSR
jgi:hypothetical protein